MFVDLVNLWMRTNPLFLSFFPLVPSIPKFHKIPSVGLLETFEDGTIAPDGFQAPEHRLPTVDDSVLQGRWEITFEGDPPPGWLKRNRVMHPTQEVTTVTTMLSKLSRVLEFTARC